MPKPRTDVPWERTSREACCRLRREDRHAALDLVVYPNPIDPTLEEDVQWIFFRTMAFDPGGRLRIVDESGRTWRVDVARRLSEPAR